MELYIPIILGTAREGRMSERAALYMERQIKEAGITTEILDVRDYAVPATLRGADGLEAVQEKMQQADGYVIVSPEYNHGYPGELKIFLDHFYVEYARKPIGICGVSNGGMGGVRMAEQLRLVFIEFHAVPIREALYFSRVQDLLDEQGKIADESYGERARKFLEELVWYASALKTAREKS